MNEPIKELIRGIKIRRDILEKIKKNRDTVDYLSGLDYDSMPDIVKNQNISLLKQAEQELESFDDGIIEHEENFIDEDISIYIEDFSKKPFAEELYYDISCLKKIIDSAKNDLTENIRKEINASIDKKTNSFNNLKKELYDHIQNKVYGIREQEQESLPKEEIVAGPVKKELDFTPKKSSKSPREIKEIIENFVKINETIFNKIIFESRQPTISITERILDISYRHGSGYVVNFISEPDTNYGKFYKNLLKVFKEIREHMCEKYDIVICPEEGKNLSYLNSFYQNYIFVREKIDTALTQFKLKNSLLNENFFVKNMLFEKTTGKYLVIFTGNKELSKAVEPYFQNQARLGSMNFDTVFVELKTDLKTQITERLVSISNRIELSEVNNYMTVSSAQEAEKTSVITDISGVKIVFDPEVPITETEVDIVVMSNARGSQTDVIPSLMKNNPGAKLFTSDISYKISRLKWIKELNSPVMNISSENNIGYDRQDIESINERVIRITPEGKGYNYKNTVNIKFFNSGVVPGSAAVEIRDASKKSLYFKYFSDEDTTLMTGGEVDMSYYDHFINCANRTYPYSPIPSDLIREKLAEGKQVFIFSDLIGNYQHIAKDIYLSALNKTASAGDQSYSLISKELTKIINFGSSWCDFFHDREKFAEALNLIEPFSDEYEFYKKFSLSDPQIFIIPFERSEIDMVIKNKLCGNHLILVPAEYEKDFSISIKNDPLIPDEYKKEKIVTYNYIRNISDRTLCEIEKKLISCKSGESLKVY